MSTFINWFSDVTADSEHLSTQGKKITSLIKAEFPLLFGFLIHPAAYFSFLQENGIDYKIKQILSTISIDRPDSLMQGEFLIKQLFQQSKLSDIFIDELLNYYYELDTDEVSLSLYETGIHGRKLKKLNAENEEVLIEQIKNAWAEMFTSHALWHRHQRLIPHLHTGAEIVVQQKIKADSSGVAITIDPITHAKDKIVILTKTPHEKDKYVLSKRNMTIIDRSITHQTKKNKLTQDEIYAIASLAKELEQFLYFPQDISWAIADDNLYITDIKPVSTLAQQPKEKKIKLPIARGKGLTSKIGSGVVTIIHTQSELESVKSHSILVVTDIDRKHMQTLKKVQGIISESAQTHPEVIMLLQRYGIPAVSHVKHATKHLRNGHVITIHSAKGEIYEGGFL